MKKLILSIFSLVVLTTQVCAQQRIYVCEGFRYDVYDITSADDIRFSSDGLEVSIGNYDTYDIDEIDSITFAEPQFPRIDIKFEENTASVQVGGTAASTTRVCPGASMRWVSISPQAQARSRSPSVVQSASRMVAQSPKA